jgi:hypothetical protein
MLQLLSVPLSNGVRFFQHPLPAKTVHRAYAKRAFVKIPSLEEYEAQGVFKKI